MLFLYKLLKNKEYNLKSSNINGNGELKMKHKLISFFVLTIIFLQSTFSYANIEENEPVDANQITQEIMQASSNIQDIPSINSRAAIVIDRLTKKILFAKNESDVRKMASTTKIMTAIVVIESANLYDTVTVSKKAAATGGSNLGVKEGDKITICDLLYGLLLESGNDAAVALAEAVGGSVEGFAEMMNKKAKEIGLNNTNFVTPHGLDNEGHYTTAYELAILADYALNNKTFYNFVSTKNYTITINGAPKNISNTNELLGTLNGVYGVKTGFTNGANRCLVTACKRNNLDIICVVLGADTKKHRTQDSIKLIEYTYKNYTTVDLKKIVYDFFTQWKLENIAKFNINKASTKNIDLEIDNFNYTLYPVKKENTDAISLNIECNYNVDAPINTGSNLGTLYVNIGDEDVLKFDIINKNKINKKNCFNYFYDFSSNFFKYLTITN